MNIHSEFLYEPCVTIHYTNDETLEGSRCCQLLQLVQLHLMLVCKVGVDLATFVPTHDKKNQGLMTIVYDELQCQCCILYNQSLYL